jgi:DNA mismatch repair protein MutS2
MDANDIHFEDLLSDLEQSRVTIEKEHEEINAYKQEIAHLKDELQHKSDRLDERKEKIIRKANEEAAAILKEAKEYADQTIKTMNKHGLTVKELEKQRSDIREKMNKKQEKLNIAPAKPKSHKAHDLSEFKEGMHVRVLSMNLIGVVTAKPNTKGEITVQMGALSTKTKISNLEILENYKDAEEKTSKGVGGSGKIKMKKSSSISSEINLLGLTVDEAVSRLEKYLDDAYLSGIPQVRVVHGKGTGALRNGVTAYLRGVPYVKSFRLGEIGEGDTGVTIVDF